MATSCGTLFYGELGDKERSWMWQSCVEGEALDWYHWKEDQMTVDNWVEFGQLLWKRFNQSRGKTCTSEEVAARELCLGISLTV